MRQTSRPLHTSAASSISPRHYQSGHKKSVEVPFCTCTLLPTHCISDTSFFFPAIILVQTNRSYSFSFLNRHSLSLLPTLLSSHSWSSLELYFNLGNPSYCYYRKLPIQGWLNRVSTALYKILGWSISVRRRWEWRMRGSSGVGSP